MALRFASRALLVLSVTPVLFAVACSAAPPSEEELDGIEQELPNCPQPNAVTGSGALRCPDPRPEPDPLPPPPPQVKPPWAENTCGSGKYLVTTTTGTCPVVGNNGFGRWVGTGLFPNVATGKCSYRWSRLPGRPVVTPNWKALAAIALKTPYVASDTACDGKAKPLIFSDCANLPDDTSPAPTSVSIHADAKPRSIAPGCMYGEMVGCGSCAVAISDHIYVTLDPSFAQRGDVAIGLGSPDSWVLAPHTPGDQIFQVTLPSNNTIPENVPLVVGIYIPGG